MAQLRTPHWGCLYQHMCQHGNIAQLYLVHRCWCHLSRPLRSTIFGYFKLLTSQYPPTASCIYSILLRAVTRTLLKPPNYYLLLLYGRGLGGDKSMYHETPHDPLALPASVSNLQRARKHRINSRATRMMYSVDLHGVWHESDVFPQC